MRKYRIVKKTDRSSGVQEVSYYFQHKWLGLFWVNTMTKATYSVRGVQCHIETLMEFQFTSLLSAERHYERYLKKPIEYYRGYLLVKRKPEFGDRQIVVVHGCLRDIWHTQIVEESEVKSAIDVAKLYIDIRTPSPKIEIVKYYGKEETQSH